MKVELTERQKQVVKLIAADVPMKQIGARLGISAKTAEYHWAKLKGLLGVRSHVGLTRWALKAGLVHLCLVLFAGSASAAPVTLLWSSVTNVPGLGYRLYGSTNRIADTQVPIVVDCRTNCQVTVEVSTPGFWWFAATSYAKGTNTDGSVYYIDSDFSEQLRCYVPPAVGTMAVVTLQHNATLATTNWQDLGFFRVKLGVP